MPLGRGTRPHENGRATVCMVAVVCRPIFRASLRAKQSQFPAPNEASDKLGKAPNEAIGPRAERSHWRFRKSAEDLPRTPSSGAERSQVYRAGRGSLVGWVPPTIRSRVATRRSGWWAVPTLRDRHLGFRGSFVGCVKHTNLKRRKTLVRFTHPTRCPPFERRRSTTRKDPGHPPVRPQKPRSQWQAGQSAKRSQLRSRRTKPVPPRRTKPVRAEG
jgi:hypothetical protein